MNARLTTRTQKLVAGAGATMIAGVAAALVIHYSLGWHRSQSDTNMIGTVQIPVDGSTCRRLVIDHRTGTVKSDERVPCVDPAKDSRTSNEARAPKEFPRGQKKPAQSEDGSESRYSSGGRIDAVRDSFNKR